MSTGRDDTPEISTAAFAPPRATDASPPAPPTLPDLELIRPLGRGGFGEVWLGKSLVGVPVAIKLLPKNEKTELEIDGIRRYQLHARQHPHLVAVHHVGQTHDHFYYVLELADSVTTAPIATEEQYEPRTLRSELVRRGRLPVDECVQVTRALLQALSHLHRHSLLHRDVKPDNVVWVGGEVKLADLGLVTSLSQPRSGARTPRYAPPGGVSSPRGDLHSVGCVLLEMLHGRLAEPEEGATATDPSEDPRWPALARVARQAMATSGPPAFLSADEMLRAVDVAARSSGEAPPAALARGVRAHRLSPRVAVPLSFGVVAAVVAILLYLEIPRPEPETADREVPARVEPPAAPVIESPADRGLDTEPLPPPTDQVTPATSSPGAIRAGSRFEGVLDVLIKPSSATASSTKGIGRGAWSARTGDLVRLAFRLPQERYACLVWIDAAGNPSLLNSTASAARVREYATPADRDSFYPLTEPKGTEVVLLVTSEQPTDTASLLERIRRIGRPPALSGDVVLDLDGTDVTVTTPPTRRGLDTANPVHSPTDPVLRYLQDLREAVGSGPVSLRGYAFPHE